MDEKNRIIVIFMVLIGILGGLVAGGALVVTRTVGITDDKARYFQDEYRSAYDIYIGDEDDDPERLIFKSIETSDDDEMRAVILFDDEKYDNTKVSLDGKILSRSGREKAQYFFMWWEEEDLVIDENANGFGQAIISEDKVKEIRDPYGLFLDEDETYEAVCQEALVYLRGEDATQASFKYLIQRKDNGAIVGDAIIDQTSGLPFEMNLYEQNKTSIRMVLIGTNFPISRNRERLLLAASISIPVSLVALYFILKKKRKVEDPEEMRDCMLLGVIGGFGAWLDQFLDFWWTYTELMPILIVLHFVPTILLLIYRRDLLHYSFIPLLELGLYGTFMHFNMGLYVLWLVYGNFILFLALGAHFAYTNEGLKGGRKTLLTKTVEPPIKTEPKIEGK